MAKQQKDELPLMDDFTEDSLLDQLEEDTSGDAAGDDDEKDDDDDSSKDDESSDDTDEGSDEEDSSDDDSDSDEDDADEDGEEKPDRKKAKASKKDSDESDTEDKDDKEESFWSDVEKLTGRTVDVDYGETDPETAEGAALREEALIQSSITDHLDYLAKIYPREFRALEHASNGGKMEDLYNPAEPDYSKIEIGDDDVDAQKTFMNSYYQKKGFSATKAKRMTDADEDSDEGLGTATKDALKELSTDQEKSRNKVIAEQKKSDQASKRQDMQMIGSVEKVVQSGKLDKFTIPVKEREKFYQHALSNMQRNPNGGYMFVQTVEPQDLEKQLQEMYFAFKGGDLSKIIQRGVTTEGARKLKRAGSGKAANKIGSGKGAGKGKNRKGLPTFDDHTE
jgi:hypothetical protein